MMVVTLLELWESVFGKCVKLDCLQLPGEGFTFCGTGNGLEDSNSLREDGENSDFEDSQEIEYEEEESEKHNVEEVNQMFH